MTIFFATKVRGFFKHLFSNKKINASFTYSTNQVYETGSNVSKLLAKMIRFSICDFLGIIQVVTKKNETCDLYGSYNRFLNTDKSYFIYVENPTALFHYSINRSKTLLGKRKVSKCINDVNLKALVFMSKACANTFESVCHSIPSNIEKRIIYPYVPSNSQISVEDIKLKSQTPQLKLLYIAQGMRFTSKGGLEVIDAFVKLYSLGYTDISLTMITSIDEIDQQLKDRINRIEGIKLYDFKFDYQQMERMYAESHILLQPTSEDSFGLTILEAMKAGLPVLTTKLYSIPELIVHGKNGFLTEPHYWFFDQNNIPNPTVWNSRKETIYSEKISDSIISFLCNSIINLNNDRSLLEKMSLSSYRIAHSFPFDEESIVDQWNSLIEKITKISD